MQAIALVQFQTWKNFLWSVIVFSQFEQTVRRSHSGILGFALLSFYRCKIVLNDPRPQFYALMTLSVPPVQILVHLLLHLGWCPLPHTVLHQLVEVLLRQAHTPLHDNILIMILKNYSNPQKVNSYQGEVLLVCLCRLVQLGEGSRREDPVLRRRDKSYSQT